MKRVTLNDIAKAADVSVATVSLALRGRGELSKKRVREIRALAERMGYRPNPMLASLAAKRFTNAQSHQDTPIAVLEFPPVPGFPNTAQSLYKHTLTEESKRLGYAPTSVSMDEVRSTKGLFRQLFARSTQGVIIVGNMDMAAFGADFDWRAFAVVQCARYLNENPFHRVRPNIFQSIKLAFTQVRERGYQRIGCAPGRHKVLLEDDEDRLGAALSLEMAYLPRKHRLSVYQGDFDDRAAFLKWFHTQRPDVVLGFNILHYIALKEEGVDIPGDVGFALLQGAEEHADISGLIQNTDEIARQSVLLLDQLIRNHEHGPASKPLEILIPSSWNDGQTLRTSI